MAGRVFAPLIIGITGKRDLKGKDVAVRAALREAFELLDRHFKHTPKILLSALAQGADLIAAEEALQRADEQRKKNPPGCSWRVVAPIPLPPELYLEDFDPESAQRFHELRGRIPMQVLDPLLRPVPGYPFKRGPPFEWAELHRHPDGNPDRTAHYEQVGLHISDQCGVLIAVMPRDEPPEKIGGTARIVDYRVRATFDPKRRDIARRSQLLASLPLDRPQPGPAWVIDLATLDSAKSSQRGAIELWEPVMGEDPADSRPVKIDPTPLTRPWQVTRLWLATAIDRFNAQVRLIPETTWRKEIEERAGSDSGDASSWLRRVRLALSFVQGRYKRKLVATLSTLAILFVAAIVLLEVHIEFEHDFPIYPYAVFFSLILAIYGTARAWRFQQHSEDYRAVSEALRVQLGWWDAGLSEREHRVERTYLGVTGGSLGRVRTAVRHLIDSALYVASAPKRVAGSERRWLNGQIAFFAKRIEERHASLSFAESVAWFLFTGSLGMALFLVSLGQNTVERAHGLLAWLGPHHAVLAEVAVVLGLFFLQQGLLLLARNASIALPLRWVPRMLSFLPAVAAGCVVSILLVQAAIIHADCGWRLESHCADAAAHPAAHLAAHYAHKLILITMIGIVAIAGAMRYLADKLSREHELFSYRDALVTFRRALEDLDEIGSDTSAEAQKLRRDILVAVGKEALDENEAWIRAHRLRPLEPIVGG